MKIGFCSCDVKQMELLLSLGYDFVEVNNGYIYSLPEEDLSHFEKFSTDHPGFIYSCNCLIPGDLRLTGPDVDFDKIRSFCEGSFYRLARLGVKMLVFGSSKAKEVPDGFPREKAMEQLVDCVRLFSEIADRQGMRVCIEPLRRAECNIINTAQEAHELAILANRPNVGSHVDFYHMMQNGEKLSCLKDIAKDIIHIHIASPVERAMPTYDDGADYGFFFNMLREGGYDGTVALEGRGSNDPAELKTMLEYLKGL